MKLDRIYEINWIQFSLILQNPVNPVIFYG